MYQLDIPKIGQLVANIITNYGDISICLFEEKTPKTVENFIKHARNGYYDNTIFHRVINEFMIQGGDPLGSGFGGESIWEEPFEDEFSPDLKNIRGALSMANSGPNTNGSQFFIVQNNSISKEYLEYLDKIDLTEEQKEYYKNNGGCFWLDNKHTVFGQVFKGMDIVDKIAKVKTDFQDKPLNDIVIDTIKIERFN